MENFEEDKEFVDTPPAVFGRWKNLYIIVIGNLVLMIILFYLFTLAFQ